MLHTIHRAEGGVRLFFGSLICLLWAFSASAVYSQVDREVLDQAENLFDQEKFVEAASLYRQILEQAPKDFNANFKLGLCELTQKNYSDAIVMLTAASEGESPLMHEVYFYRGFSYFRLDKPDLALADYTKAIEIKPDYEDAFNNRAQVYEQRNDAAAAIQDYQSALTIDSTNPGLWYNVGRLLATVGNCGEAILAFNTAIEHNPQYPEALMLRGNCHLLVKLVSRAQNDFKTLLELQPGNFEAMAKLGYCQTLLGNNTEGCPNISRAIEGGFVPAEQMYAEQCKQKN